jgi:aryl-alcohol dehydrogenase-like predicted oxidoreductase
MAGSNTSKSMTIANDMRISTRRGTPASCLGLAARPDQDSKCIRWAFGHGINFFFFYGPGNKPFITELALLIKRRADDVIIATGSGSRTKSGLRAARRKIVSLLGTDQIDVFFAEYINPGDDLGTIFGGGGVLDELQQWKASGQIRYVGASAHDRKLASRLAQDSRVDVLMHRYNMAHRKAESEVFPVALKSGTPVIAFTATRWGTLLAPHPEWSSDPPTAADCYLHCLAQAAVQLVLTAPTSIAELRENQAVLKLPPMRRDACNHWNRFGDIVYKQGSGSSHEFESQWP